MDILIRWSLRVACGFLLIGMMGAGAQEVREYQVKAAFLYKFVEYVVWPEEHPINAGQTGSVIGIASSGDMLASLTGFAEAQQAAGSEDLVLRRVVNESDIDGLHVLFIGKAATSAQRRRLLDEARARGILAVTESDGEAPSGSMINFRVIGDRVRFSVDLGPVQNAGLQLSSRLLQVAESVRVAP